MSRVQPAGLGELRSRARSLIVRPSAAWDKIAEETGSARTLLMGWVAPLAAVPAVCGALGVTIFGIGFFGVGLRPPFGVAFAEMLAGYALTFAGVYLVALAAEAVAPLFGGRRDHLGALRLVAYSAAPYWLSGFFQLYPPIGWLAAVLGGLYSLYLMYLGLPRLLGVSGEQRVTAFAVLLFVVLAVSVATGVITSAIGDLGGPLVMAAA
jgi:hypothetical protein